MARAHQRRGHGHVRFGTQPPRSRLQCVQGILFASAVSAKSIDPVAMKRGLRPPWQVVLGPLPFGDELREGASGT
jgi:hypothetical protein